MGEAVQVLPLRVAESGRISASTGGAAFRQLSRISPIRRLGTNGMHRQMLNAGSRELPLFHFVFHNNDAN